MSFTSGAEEEREIAVDAAEELGHDATHNHGDPHESPWVVTVPLVLLAIPSIYSGWAYVDQVLFGGYFGESIAIAQQHAGLATMTEEWHGPWAFVVHGVTTLPFWLALAGIAAAWYCYLVNPALPERLKRLAGPVYTLLDNKYYFDKFNDWFFAGGARRIGGLLSNVGDGKVIEGIVNGAASMVGWWAAMLRKMQSGYIYHYAFTMIIGLFALLTWWVVR